MTVLSAYAPISKLVAQLHPVVKEVAVTQIFWHNYGN